MVMVKLFRVCYRDRLLVKCQFEQARYAPVYALSNAPERGPTLPADRRECYAGRFSAPGLNGAKLSRIWDASSARRVERVQPGILTSGKSGILPGVLEPLRPPGQKPSQKLLIFASFSPGAQELAYFAVAQRSEF